MLDSSVNCVCVWSTKKLTMPAYCVATNCNNLQTTPGITMHELPHNRSAMRRKWIKFIQFKRADFLAAPHHTHLCREHFSECDFTNTMEYRSGVCFKADKMFRYSFKILADRLKLIWLYPCRSLRQSISFIFRAWVGHFAATPQSDIVGIWSRDLGVMATFSVQQKMPIFHAFITLRSQFHLHHCSQWTLTEIVSKITSNLGLVLYASWTGCRPVSQSPLWARELCRSHACQCHLLVCLLPSWEKGCSLWARELRGVWWDWSSPTRKAQKMPKLCPFLLVKGPLHEQFAPEGADLLGPKSLKHPNQSAHVQNKILTNAWWGITPVLLDRRGVRGFGLCMAWRVNADLSLLCKSLLSFVTCFFFFLGGGGGGAQSKRCTLISSKSVLRGVISLDPVTRIPFSITKDQYANTRPQGKINHWQRQVETMMHQPSTCSCF